MRTLVTLLGDEPVSVEEAKAQLRVIQNSDDALLARQIASAREYVENETGRALVEATYRAQMPLLCGDLRLPLQPLAAVSALTYVGPDGARTTIDPDTYALDTDWAVVRAAAGWPLYARDAVVEFTTDPGQVPEGLKTAILLRVQAEYEAAPAEADQLRAAASEIAFQYRVNLGV